MIPAGLVCALSQPLAPLPQQILGAVLEVWLRVSVGNALVVVPGVVRSEANNSAIHWTPTIEAQSLQVVLASADQMFIRLRCAYLFDLRQRVFSSLSRAVLAPEQASFPLPVLPGGVLESWTTIQRATIFIPVTRPSGARAAKPRASSPTPTTPGGKRRRATRRR